MIPAIGGPRKGHRPQQRPNDNLDQSSEHALSRGEGAGRGSIDQTPLLFPSVGRIGDPAHHSTGLQTCRYLSHERPACQRSGHLRRPLEARHGMACARRAGGHPGDAKRLASGGVGAVTVDYRVADGVGETPAGTGGSGRVKGAASRSASATSSSTGVFRGQLHSSTIRS